MTGRKGRVLADTSVLIDFMRGHKPAVDWVLKLWPGGLCASVVTLNELLVGFRGSQSNTLNKLRKRLDWLEVTEDIAAQAGEWGHKYRASHMLDVPDLLICATAKVNQVELATRNVKHCPMFPSLKPPY